MATLTRLASTLTAKFSPSQTLTDAFYMDGRFCGKRETRQADITIEKEERGYFFSVFTHPTIEGFEPGMLPPFEPQFKSLCNDVKFGHKEIDGLIEKFLSTAVEVTGKMRLSDNELRSPYFSGIIVKDAEAFAVTIGHGLAFLYRDDTLFPLTDAGVPMEAIDAFDNRVGDFMYYCASKTANALWSNYFTLSPDDCIILCNKAIYDALGQRELLRILNEAEDQCDAAGVIITQASARMPNVPMQVSISFVENVTNNDKRGIFGFKKKSKDDDDSDSVVESVVEGGVVGAAAEAVSDAGFVSLTAAESAGSFVAAPAAAEAAVAAGTGVAFGEAAADAVTVPPVNQEATDMGFEVGEVKDEDGKTASIEFLDNSVSIKDGSSEISPEALLKKSLEDMEQKPGSEGEMETVSVSAFEPETSTDDEPTKPITNLDASIFAGLKEGGVLASAIRNSVEENSEDVIPVTEEPVKAETAASDFVISAPAPEAEPSVAEVPEAPKQDEIVFDAVDDSNGKFFDVPSEESFNPYSAGDPDEMKNAAPLIFGDDSNAAASVPEEEPLPEVSEIPVPDFEIESPKPEIQEEDKLNVDFPEVEPEVKVEPEKEEFKLPFANEVDTVGAPEAVEDVPEMPQYDANVFDTPVNAVNSEQPINAESDDTYAYGEYDEPKAAEVNDAFFTSEAPKEEIPYQPYGSEAFQVNDQEVYQNPQEAPYVPEGQPQFDQPQYEQPQYEQPQYQQQYQQPVGEDPYQEPGSTSSSSGSTDDAWIMDLLGVDDNDYSRDVIPETPSSQFVGGGQPAPAAPQAQYGAAPSAEYGAPQNAGGTRPQQGGAPRRPSGGAHQPSGTRNGGNGGGNKPKFHLNRNGYIFIAFVVLLLICLTIMLSIIIKSCSDKSKETSSESSSLTLPSITGDATTPSSDSAPTGDTTDSQATGNTDNTDNTGNTDNTSSSDQTSGTGGTAINVNGNPDNPSAPIGSFKFSDYIGRRTWWDLFYYVYGVKLSDMNDPMIKKIKQYNNFPDSYTPNSGDTVLLPPQGVLDGTVPNTFIPGGGETTGAGEEGGDAATTTTTAAEANP